MYWRCSSSDRAPALQAQSPEFKPLTRDRQREGERERMRQRQKRKKEGSKEGRKERGKGKEQVQRLPTENTFST
jgi:hypothetical protein